MNNRHCPDELRHIFCGLGPGHYKVEAKRKFQKLQYKLQGIFLINPFLKNCQIKYIKYLYSVGETNQLSNIQMVVFKDTLPS